MFDLAEPFPLDADTRIRIPLSCDSAWAERYTQHVKDELKVADKWPDAFRGRISGVFDEHEEIGSGVFKVPEEQLFDDEGDRRLPVGWEVDSKSDGFAFVRPSAKYVDSYCATQAAIASAKWVYGGVWPDGWESGPVACAIVKPLSSSERAVVKVSAGDEPERPDGGDSDPDDPVAKNHRRWSAIMDDARLALQLVAFEQGGKEYGGEEFLERVTRKSPERGDALRFEVIMHLRRLWIQPYKLGKEYAGLSGCAPR